MVKEVVLFSNKYVENTNNSFNHENLLIPGRIKCTCLAQRHDLVNSCSSCGRIVCQQEGSGPCFTCNKLVCTPKEEEVLSRNSNKSTQLLSKLKKARPVESKEEINYRESIEKAIEQKNKLLERDKLSLNSSNKVIDDQSDYYSSKNIWIDPKTKKLITEYEKNQLLDKECNRRLRDQLEVAFDIEKKKFVEIVEEKSNKQTEIIDRFERIEKNNILNKDEDCLKAVKFKIKPSLSLKDPNKFYSNVKKNFNSPKTKPLDSIKDNWINRVQHIPIQVSFSQMQYNVCLNLSNDLVHKIFKKHKHFILLSFYSSHRGFLSISSKNIEKENDGNRYIIGCVSLMDCVHISEFMTCYNSNRLNEITDWNNEDMLSNEQIALNNNNNDNKHIKTITIDALDANEFENLIRNELEPTNCYVWQITFIRSLKKPLKVDDCQDPITILNMECVSAVVDELF